MRFLADPGFRAVCLYRAGHRFAAAGFRVRAKIFQELMLHWSQCTISVYAEIGPGFRILHVGGVVVGSRSHIGRNCEIRQGVTIGGNKGRILDGRTQPIIGDDVQIAAGAKVIGPVRVGDRCFIGANAVVLTDLPRDAIAVGIPATVVSIGGQKIPRQDRRDSAGLLFKEILARIESLESRSPSASDAPR